MALGALTLSITAGVQGRPFQATIIGLTTGKVEVLGDGSPGFSTVNGKVMSSGLPYPVSTVVLREYDPGAATSLRDSRIEIVAATTTSLLAQAVASIPGGRILTRYRVAGNRQPDGSIVYTLLVEDDLGVSASYTPLTSGTPTPPPAEKLAATGDSITKGVTGPTPYGDTYAAANPALPYINISLNGRVVGTAANLNNSSDNSVSGHFAEIVAFAPTLSSLMIGANDFTTGSDATYRTNLINLRAAYGSSLPNTKQVWSGPFSYNPTGTPHPSKSAVDAQRATLFANGATGARNPAVWSQWCDFYWPGGEIPEFPDTATAAPLFDDTVHPSAAGYALIYKSYKAVIDSIRDAGRVSSTQMYDAAWTDGIGSTTNQPASTRIRRRFVVSGLAPAGTALGASVSGAGNPLISLNGRTFASSCGTGSANGYRLYNGDTIWLELDTSASGSTGVAASLTIGSETRLLTYTTVASVTPASIADGGYDGTRTNIGTAAASQTYAAKTFDAGCPIVALDTVGVQTTGVTVNGVALTRRILAGFMEVWTGPAMAAGNYDIVVSKGAVYQSRLGILWATAKNVDPTPTFADGINRADVAPHTTPTGARPASGLLLGFANYLGLTTDPGVAIHSSDTTSVMVRKGLATYSGDGGIIAMAQKPASGAVSFTKDAAGSYDNVWVATFVFKAAGT